MKKNLWMLGVAVAALTSCAQSEVLDIAESKTINFDSFVGKQTKAVDDVGQTENFDVFYAHGAKGTTADGIFTADSDADATFFNGEKVYRNKKVSPETGWYNWTYDTPKPWTVDKTYRFAAYANGHGANTDDAKLNSGVSFNSKMSNVQALNGQNLNETWGFELTNYAASTKDLIFSVPAEEKRTTTAELVNTMNMTFEHALAKVIFRFVLDQSANQNLRVEIEPFKLTAIKTSDCKVYHHNDSTEINWAAQGIKATDVDNANSANNITTGDYEVVSSGNLTLEKDDTNTLIIENDQSIAFYVIPQSNDITVTFSGSSFDDGDNEVGTTTFSNVSLKIANHEQWKPGYVYRYTASLNPQINYIHFAANVETWKDDSSRDQGIVGSASSSASDGGE